MEGNWSECMCKDLLSVKTQKWLSLACWCDAGRSAEKMTKVCQEGKSLLKDKNSITRTFSLPRWWQVQSLKRHKKGALQLSMWSTGVLHMWIVQAQSSEKVTVFVFFRMRYTALSLTLYCGNVNVCIIIVKPSWYCGLWQNVWMHHALHTFLFPQILKHRSYIAFK